MQSKFSLSLLSLLFLSLLLSENGKHVNPLVKVKIPTGKCQTSLIITRRREVLQLEKSVKKNKWEKEEADWESEGGWGRRRRDWDWVKWRVSEKGKMRKEDGREEADRKGRKEKEITENTDHIHPYTCSLFGNFFFVGNTFFSLYSLRWPNKHTQHQ